MVVAGLYDWLLFGHVLAAMVWLGGGLILAVQAARTVRARDPVDVKRFLGNLRVLGPRVLGPATIALVGLGVWMVLDSSTWGFGQAWVQLALTLFGLALVIGAAHQSRAAVKGERAAQREDHNEALRQLARWSWGYALILLLLVAATWDMLNKPGL